jgi:hypothetical protein
MAEGRVAFAGPTKDAMAFFESVGHPSPGNFNPADHYIRVLSVVPRQEKECRKRIKVCAGRPGQLTRTGNLWFIRDEHQWRRTSSTY